MQPIEFDASRDSLAASGNSPDAGVKAQHFVGVKSSPITADYEFKSMVGKGAFGTVTIAEHRKLKVNRAVKKIPKSQLDTAELWLLTRLIHSAFQVLTLSSTISFREDQVNLVIS